MAAEAFAGVFDQGKFVLLGDLFQFDHAARVAERFDGDDRTRLGSDGGLHLRDIHVQRARVDIDEYRPGIDVENAVGGSDEGEGRRDHLFTRRHACGDHRAMQAGRSAGNRDTVASPRDAGAIGLELLNPRPDRKRAAVQHVRDRLDLLLRDVGLRERNDHGCRVPDSSTLGLSAERPESYITRPGRSDKAWEAGRQVNACRPEVR